MPDSRFGPRLTAALLLTLVALVGVLAGVALERLVLAQPAGAAPAVTAPPPRPADDEPRPGALMRRRFFEQMGRELELTPAQRVRIDSILVAQQQRVRELQRELRPRFREITRETRLAIDSVLTPEQRARIRELQREIRARGVPRGDAPPGRRHPAPPPR